MRHRNCFFFTLANKGAGTAAFAFAIVLLIASMASVLFTSCSESSSFLNPAQERVTVMTWNTQTFFDSVDSGTEFDEFRDTKNGWNAEKYGERLDRLCSVLTLCGKRTGMETGAGPDIVVLEEIENEGVVRDICNRLNQRSTYRYAAFVPPAAGSAFGSAVLSRYPVTRVTAHSVDPANAPNAEEISLRPMLEVKLIVGEDTLTVFAVHWKSKSGETDGGNVEDTPSARARLAQERLLVERIALLDAECEFWIACGDFNQRYDEFTLMGDYGNCWDDWLARCDSGEIPGPAGSYYYKDSWDTIDNFIVPKSFLQNDGGNVREYAEWKVSDFRVVAETPIADDDLLPNRYAIFSGNGVSDHLPLVLVLEKRN